VDFIRTERSETIAVIRFDHYERRNALSEGLITELLATLAELAGEDIRAVILRSDSKHPVWSAGHDVAELPKAGQDPLPFDDVLERLLRAVRNFRAPVIAMVDGSAWGGACDLTMACDIVTGDEDAAFAITPAKLGLPYNASGIQHFLARLPLNTVNEMFFTAAPIGAARAAALGILNLLTAAAELEEKTYAMARLIATRSPQAISAYKTQAQALAYAAPLHPHEFERLQSVRRNVYFGIDYAEGIRAFTEKRAPVFSQPQG
jgi:methylmalonyl-CoA decarboxylase